MSRRLGQPKKALECYHKALSIYSGLPGVSFAHSLTCNNISMVYSDLKEIDMALEYAFRGLRMREELLRKDHPSFGNSYNAIALLLLQKGEAAIGVEWALKAVEFREAILPPLHPDTGIAIYTLARAYAAAHDEARGRLTIEKSLHILRQSLRPDHPVLNNAMNDAVTLGSVLSLHLN